MGEGFVMALGVRPRLQSDTGQRIPRHRVQHFRPHSLERVDDLLERLLPREGQRFLHLDFVLQLPRRPHLAFRPGALHARGTLLELREFLLIVPGDSCWWVIPRPTALRSGHPVPREVRNLPDFQPKNVGDLLGSHTFATVMAKITLCR